MRSIGHEANFVEIDPHIVKRPLTQHQGMQRSDGLFVVALKTVRLGHCQVDGRMFPSDVDHPYSLDARRVSKAPSPDDQHSCTCHDDKTGEHEQWVARSQLEVSSTLPNTRTIHAKRATRNVSKALAPCFERTAVCS